MLQPPRPDAVVRQALLGDAATRRAVRAALERLVRLQRFESTSVAEALRGVCTSSLPFLPSTPSQGGEHQIRMRGALAPVPLD